MSIKTKIATLALTALAVTGSIAATSTPAAANGFHHHHHWGWGVGAGLVGAAVVGSAIAASNDSYSDDGGYRYCRWVPQYNVYGQYVGRVRACGY
ncbi:hypothetical protein [Bradyrhizobium sp. SZCCHNR1051]|uniref:hypothetical protein n=1 Tax=Bradyrhizobium sp. SZCCHNR1051 TaxID=3057355 RepID=UPI0029169770|nr:hypothetical protein [Bradyrhizobium sp. SZCCHNR1051]